MGKHRRIWKVCEHCGEQFQGTLKARFCGYDCQYANRRGQPPTKDSICWSCTNACGGCSWSRALVPIKGWVRERIVNRDGEMYRVKKCPQYKKGRAKNEQS